jgi:8-oxo-dGTP pyrophosphatase MutT (NUDIX family)
MARQHVALIFFYRQKQIDGNPELMVLLSRRGEYQYEESNPKPQSFFRGRQIFPGGKLEDSDLDAWHCAMRELEEEGGLQLYNWVKNVLEEDRSRLSQVNEACFAVEIKQAEVEEFLGLIELAPEHQSIDWCSISEIKNFENLTPYKNGVPINIEAIFADEAEWIEKLTTLI